MRADSQLSICEKCRKTFGSKAGWKYHTSNGVCEVKSELSDGGRSEDDDSVHSASNTGSRKRKAARKAASALAASAAADDSGDDGHDGSGKSGDGNFSEDSSAMAVSDDDTFSSDEEDDDDDNNEGEDDDSDEGSKWKTARKKAKKRKVKASPARRRVTAAYARKSGRAGAKLTAGNYSANAFTTAGSHQGARHNSLPRTSDLIIDGRGEALAAAVARRGGGGSSSSSAGGGVKCSQVRKVLEQVSVLAAAAKAKISVDLEPGARRSKTAERRKMQKQMKLKPTESTGETDESGDGAPVGGQSSADSASDAIERTAEDGDGDGEACGGVASQGARERSWREVPGLRAFVGASRVGAGEAGPLPSWEVRGVGSTLLKGCI